MRFKKKQVDIFGKIEDNMGKETIKSGRNKWNAEIRQTIIWILQRWCPRDVPVLGGTMEL